MPIYTKRGDKGKTSMYDSLSSQTKRVSKSSKRVWAIGSVDEVNSFIGICVGLARDGKIRDNLERVQRDLFLVGSTLALAKVTFTTTKVSFLEKEIDRMEGELPVLKNFILPGGSTLGSHLQYSRALTRRAERRIVALDKIEKVKPVLLQYINRLSDYLFTLARFVNMKEGIEESTWQPGSR